VRATLASEPVFSHESAAALLGLPLIGDWPEVPTVSVPDGGSTSSGNLRRVRRRLPEGHAVALDDGIRVTSLVRTAVDLAATRSLLSGIVVISALRWTGVERAEIEAVIESCGRMAGIRRARLALARSTAGSESPLETLVVVRCQDLGFQEPEQQVAVTVDGHAYRCDFAWCDGAVVGEADGRVKYAAEHSGEEALWREKRREDAIRSVRRAFVRIGWDDAWRGDGLALLLDRAGVPRSRRGRVRLTH